MNTATTVRTLLPFLAAMSLSFCASGARANAVTDWTAIMEKTILANPNPAERARTTVIMQVAVFEAVNSVTGDYDPYSEKIRAPEGASPEAAAIAAAHAVLVRAHPEKAAQLDTEREKSLAAIPEGPGKVAGIGVGVAAAEALIALRARDGFDEQIPYTPETEPGDWQPTPPDFTPAAFPGLGRVKPFVIRNVRQYRAAPPPDLLSREYARDYMEVKLFGEARSARRPEDRTRVARFYGVAEPGSIYYPAARQVSTAQGRTLSENARLLALVAIGVWDGAIACFETKYHFNVWRPVTAIRAGQTDGNPRTKPDPEWEPLVPTPPFPSYPSGHACFAGAASVILEAEFGAEGHDITLSIPELPDILLHYTTFKRIVDDINDARVYGGVHYRFDQDRGVLLGKQVGEYLLRHALRPTCDEKRRGRNVSSQPE